MEGGRQRRAVPRHICLKSSLLPQLGSWCSPEPPAAVFSHRLVLLSVGATPAEVFDLFAQLPCQEETRPHSFVWFQLNICFAILLKRIKALSHLRRSKLHDRMWLLVFETHPFPMFIFQSPPFSLKFSQSSYCSWKSSFVKISLKQFSLF